MRVCGGGGGGDGELISEDLVKRGRDFTCNKKDTPFIAVHYRDGLVC